MIKSSNSNSNSNNQQDTKPQKPVMHDPRTIQESLDPSKIKKGK